jgi:transcriptional activator SPT7
MMNSNIKTLKRVRRTHAKFAALNLNAEDGGVADLDEPPETAEDYPVDEFVDERPWKTLVGLKCGDIESGAELGGERAVHCLRWMNGKVLEHAGFQGECSVVEMDTRTESLRFRKVPLL